MVLLVIRRRKRQDFQIIKDLNDAFGTDFSDDDPGFLGEGEG